MSNPERWLRWLVLFVATFHVVAGVGLTFFPSFQAWAVTLYGAEVQWTHQSVYFVRIMGTFALALGLILFATARHPTRHQGVILSVATFFLLRSVIRHLHAVEVYEGFAISPLTNMVTSIFFMLQAVGLAGLVWMVRRAGESHPIGG